MRALGAGAWLPCPRLVRAACRTGVSRGSAPDPPSSLCLALGHRRRARGVAGGGAARPPLRDCRPFWKTALIDVRWLARRIAPPDVQAAAHTEELVQRQGPAF